MLRTVLGDIDPGTMGVTLSHEHILYDGSSWFQEPTAEGDRKFMDADVRLDNLWWMRQHPYSNQKLLRFDDEDLAVSELSEFRKWGGTTVIEVSSLGLARDVGGLARVAERTALNIVAGAGYYVEFSHPEDVASATVDELCNSIVRDIEEGVAGTGIRAGVIGEIGVSWPIRPKEEKVLRAAARAQSATGAAVTVHTPYQATTAEAGLVIADILETEGADLRRVVMGHLDNTLANPGYHCKLAERGCYLEFDGFGCEVFESEFDFVYPSDSARVAAIRDLVKEGLADRLLLSHDMGYKFCLQSYGGYGYAHILRNIMPRLVLAGVPESTVTEILTENPRRVFPLASSGA
jgi:phosphotriesterase-related protein